MNISRFSLFGLALLLPLLAFGQDIVPPPSKVSIQAPPLTKFDLDFPGGTPGQLVSAIETATGKPLNAVIPSEFAAQQLPPLKMKGVDVVHLFDALRSVGHSQHPVFYANGNGTYLYFSWGFLTQDRTPTDASIWCFFLTGNSSVPPPLPICRFYLLTPYLERGLTVDDITTAVQTGWKMLGESNNPTLSFHKETKLLIAVGEQRQLDVVDSTLRALDSSKPRTVGPVPMGSKAP